MVGSRRVLINSQADDLISMVIRVCPWREEVCRGNWVMENMVKAHFSSAASHSPAIRYPGLVGEGHPQSKHGNRWYGLLY